MTSPGPTPGGTSSAVVFDTYGPPEVLRLVPIETPVPGPGEVRIQVRAAGVQPFDCATRRGDFAQYNPLELPARLGNEVAGVVDLVGSGVDGVRPGDEVIAYLMMQGYATAVVVPAIHTVPKPATMPWAEAGALSASGQTALTALDELEVGADDTLLVHAAAGGVGSFAVQLAHERGARVIGTASERNHDYLRELGAIPVIYGDGLADRVRQHAPDGVDAALDCVGGEALDVSVALVPDRARVVTIADWLGAQRLGIRRIGTERSPAKLRYLTNRYAAGKLKVEVAHQIPLSEAASAHREVETGHIRGKVVLIDEPGAQRPTA